METIKIIYCTCPTQLIAETIATSLVQQKLAACASILPAIKSIYIWNNKLENCTECLLMIKAPEHHVTAIETAICALHPYDVPEIIAIDITHGHKPYLEWVAQNTARENEI